MSVLARGGRHAVGVLLGRHTPLLPQPPLRCQRCWAHGTPEPADTAGQEKQQQQQQPPQPLEWVRKARYDELVAVEPGTRLPSEYSAYNAEENKWVLRYGFIPELLGKNTQGIQEELPLDAYLPAWLRGCIVEPVPRRLQQLLHLLYRMPGMYFYDAQVFLDAPSLLLLTPEQWRKVIPESTLQSVARAMPHTPRNQTPVLDVGAGKGDLVAQYSPVLPCKVVCTEVSSLLCWKLRRTPGVQDAVKTQKAAVDQGEFELVFCLNTIDRCSDPVILLKDLRKQLRRGCCVVIAVPLPYCHIDFISNTPFSALTLEGDNTFEGSAEAVATDLLIPLGFRPKKLHRAPYFSSGPFEQPISQVLDTGIFVCEVMF